MQMQTNTMCDQKTIIGFQVLVYQLSVNQPHH